MHVFMCMYVCIYVGKIENVEQKVCMYVTMFPAESVIIVCTLICIMTAFVFCLKAILEDICTKMLRTNLKLVHFGSGLELNVLLVEETITVIMQMRVHTYIHIYIYME